MSDVPRWFRLFKATFFSKAYLRCFIIQSPTIKDSTLENFVETWLVSVRLTWLGRKEALKQMGVELTMRGPSTPSVEFSHILAIIWWQSTADNHFDSRKNWVKYEGLTIWWSRVRSAPKSENGEIILFFRFILYITHRRSNGIVRKNIIPFQRRNFFPINQHPAKWKMTQLWRCTIAHIWKPYLPIIMKPFLLSLNNLHWR